MHTHRRSSARGYDREAPRATQPPPHLSFFLSGALCPPSAPPARTPYYVLPAAGDPATWSVWGDDVDLGIGAPPLHVPWFASAVPDFVPFGSATDVDRPYGPAHIAYGAPDGAAAFGSPAGHRPWAHRIIAEDDVDAAAAPPLSGDLLSWDARECGGTARECLVDGGVVPPPDLPPPLEPVKAPARDARPDPRQKQQQRRVRSTSSRARRNSTQ
ncbi:hypothetical protein [Pandoravirus japonicus]|uniref:Uncharacterized protein n=1 Tax=Pandoravirus japonicus TaxID=2823154 RepID=A0A811BPR2_9VIRU|nr:hypothetical protein [Pandoravirus japonicus]